MVSGRCTYLCLEESVVKRIAALHIIALRPDSFNSIRSAVLSLTVKNV